MPRNRFRRSLAAVAIAAALGVSAASEARIIYHGSFDPISFKGTFDLQLDNNECANQPDGWYANSGICTATLQGAIVQVLDATPESDYVGMLTFAPPIVPDYLLYGVYIVNGELDSFDTGPLYNPSANPTTIDDWMLQFSSGEMCGDNSNYDGYCYGGGSSEFRISDFMVASVANEGDLPGTLDKGVYLSVNGGSPGSASYREITRVPEPGTMALLGIGLLAGGITRWRSMRGRTSGT